MWKERCDSFFKSEKFFGPNTKFFLHNFFTSKPYKVGLVISQKKKKKKKNLDNLINQNPKSRIIER